MSLLAYSDSHCLSVQALNDLQDRGCTALKLSSSAPAESAAGAFWATSCAARFPDMVPGASRRSWRRSRCSSRWTTWRARGPSSWLPTPLPTPAAQAPCSSRESRNWLRSHAWVVVRAALLSETRVQQRLVQAFRGQALGFARSRCHAQHAESSQLPREQELALQPHRDGKGRASVQDQGAAAQRCSGAVKALCEATSLLKHVSGTMASQGHCSERPPAQGLLFLCSRMHCGSA